MNNERLWAPMYPKILAMWEQDRRCGHHPCNCIRVVRIMVQWCTGGSGRCDSVEYLWSLSSIQHCVTQEAVIFRTPHYNPVFDVTTCHSDPDQGSRGSPPFGDCVVFCNVFIFSTGNRQTSNGNFVTFISCIANFWSTAWLLWPPHPHCLAGGRKPSVVSQKKMEDVWM